MIEIRDGRRWTMGVAVLDEVKKLIRGKRSERVEWVEPWREGIDFALRFDAIEVRPSGLALIFNGQVIATVELPELPEVLRRGDSLTVVNGDVRGEIGFKVLT